MASFNKNNLLSELHDRTEVIRNNLKLFDQLTEQQLLSKPDPDSWSIAEVFAHLNAAHQIYLGYINKALEHASISNREVYVTGWLGNFVYNKILPRPDGTVYKMRAPAYLAVKGLITNPAQVLEQFDNHLQEFDHILEQSKYIDLEKIRIPSVFTRLVRIRLGDTFRFLVAHNERHLLQAQRLKNWLMPEAEFIPSPGKTASDSDLVNVL